MLPDGILLEVGPITLQIAVSNTTLAALPRDGTPVRLVTHLYLREDQMALYGFTTETELGLFRLLLGVTGVGPKVALNICGSGEPDVVMQTIAAGDIDALARIPGIGKKTAARLVLELRGKLDALVGGALPVRPVAAQAQRRTTSSEVIAALAGARLFRDRSVHRPARRGDDRWDDRRGACPRRAPADGSIPVRDLTPGPSPLRWRGVTR